MLKINSFSSWQHFEISWEIIQVRPIFYSIALYKCKVNIVIGTPFCLKLVRLQSVYVIKVLRNVQKYQLKIDNVRIQEVLSQ